MSIFAIVGILNFEAVSAYGAQQVSGPEHNAATAEQHDQSSKKIESWHPYFVDWLSSKFGVTGCGPYSVDRLGYGKQRQENAYNNTCDLEAQESVANSTRWLLLIALLQTLLGVVGTALVWRSLKLNRDAVEIAINANKTAESTLAEERIRHADQTRSYLFVESVKIDIDDTWLRLVATIKNRGETEANDVVFEASLVVNIHGTSKRTNKPEFLGSVCKTRWDNVGNIPRGTISQTWSTQWLLDEHNMVGAIFLIGWGLPGDFLTTGKGSLSWKDRFGKTHSLKIETLFNSYDVIGQAGQRRVLTCNGTV